MSKKGNFILVSIWIIISRFYDAYATYQFTPDLKLEANPLVSILGLNWTGLLIIYCTLCLLILYLFYISSFNKFNLLPSEKGYSFKEFFTYIYLGKKDSFLKLFYKLPNSKGRLIQYVGTLFPKMLSFIGIITTLMWLGINYYEPYYYFHKAIYIYSIIIIGSLIIIYKWHKKMYLNYTKSDS